MPMASKTEDSSVRSLLFDDLVLEFSENLEWAEATSARLGLDTASGARLRDQAARLRRRLRDRNLYIAVLGEFNSGKSTFINTLIRHRLLPTASVVTLALQQSFVTARPSMSPSARAGRTGCSLSPQVSRGSQAMTSNVSGDGSRVGSSLHGRCLRP